MRNFVRSAVAAVACIACAWRETTSPSAQTSADSTVLAVQGKGLVKVPILCSTNPHIVPDRLVVPQFAEVRFVISNECSCNVIFDKKLGAPDDVPTTRMSIWYRHFNVPGKFPFSCTTFSPPLRASVAIYTR